MKYNDFKIAKNFRLCEFESPDTKEVKVANELVVKLQIIRDTIDRPIIVGSGYRTKEHNKKIGGAKNSYHMKGMAADIHCHSVKLYDLTIAAIIAGFIGIIIYKDRNFIHVDLRNKPYIKVPQEWFNYFVEMLPGIERYVIFEK